MKKLSVRLIFCVFGVLGFSSCAKKCHDFVETYMNLQASITSSSIKFSYNNTGPIRSAVQSGSQTVLLGVFESSFSTSFEKSCPTPQTKTETTKAVYLCFSEAPLTVLCKGADNTVYIISTFAGQSCPANTTQESRYALGC